MHTPGPVQEFGVGFLQFDAGGLSSAVSPNPLQSVSEVEDGQTFIKIEWILVDEMHMFQEWGVAIGNIVPCVLSNVTTNPERFQSAARQNGSRWIWRWPLADWPGLVSEIAYDIYFDYGPPSPGPLESSESSRRRYYSKPTVRGRLGVQGIDPTLLLPPKG